MKVLRLAVLLSTALAGCATLIDKHERVPGWPELKVIELYVPHAQMRDACARFVPWYSSPEGCTFFYFDQGEAHIYLSKDFPPAKWMVQHERLHAAGYDHVGSTNMRRALERWRARNTLARLAEEAK
jgi:hypothetical protein